LEVSLDGTLEQRGSEVLYSKYLEIFTTKTMMLSKYDKTWITPAIKAKIRERSYVYAYGEASQGAIVWNRVVRMVRMIRSAKTKYNREKVVPLLNSESAKWHRSIKK